MEHSKLQASSKKKPKNLQLLSVVRPFAASSTNNPDYSDIPNGLPILIPVSTPKSTIQCSSLSSIELKQSAQAAVVDGDPASTQHAKNEMLISDLL
jgi:hypothetical protein